MFRRLPYRLFWSMLALTCCAWPVWLSLTDNATFSTGRILTAALLSLVLILVPSGIAWQYERRLQNLVNLVQRRQPDLAVEIRSELARRDPVSLLNRLLGLILHRFQESDRRRNQEYTSLSTGIEELGQGFFIANAEGIVQYLSPKAKQYWVVPDDWAERELRTEVLFRTREMVYDSWSKAVSSGHLVRDLCESADGRESLLVVHIPLLSTGAQPSWLTVQQDTSEVSLMRLIRRDFIGNLSHEIRNLLAKLKANAEIVAVATNETDRGKFQQRMLATISEMSHLQEGLMDLYLIETGLETISLENTCLASFLSSVHDGLMANATRADIQFQLDAVPDICLPLDTQKITRVITNLVQNAIKFTPASGRIVLQAHVQPLPLAEESFRAGLPSSLSPAEQRQLRSDPVAIVSVKDSGPGIPAPYIPRVFERLHQLDAGKTYQGTGLGLSLARHTIRAHGGLIWASNNQPGPGITFSFSLPLSPETTAVIPLADPERKSPEDWQTATNATTESQTPPV